MNIAIIGCGLIGQKRAAAISQLSARLIACADLNFARAQNLAEAFPRCTAYSDWQEIINHIDVDAVIIATHHVALAEIALAAITLGKHVLIEKPGAHHVNAINDLILAAKKSQSLVRVGFNHRYHHALRKAKELIADEKLGELMYIRARYGHGGRLNYHEEWRANPLLSGGGELIDQGIHLIDLSRWFLGDFHSTTAHLQTYFWDVTVEDNVFLLLQTAKQQIAQLHASWTEWKNLFSFEIFGRKGKIDINGLGGSYGIPRITLYQMSKQMGPPETFSWDFQTPDDSWQLELAEFFEDIRLNRTPAVNLFDAQAALQIVAKSYEKSSNAISPHPSPLPQVGEGKTGYVHRRREC